jgi:hypothetical protein
MSDYHLITYDLGVGLSSSRLFHCTPLHYPILLIALPLPAQHSVLSVPRNFSRGGGVIPSLAERSGGGSLSSLRQRGYYQFGM